VRCRSATADALLWLKVEQRHLSIAQPIAVLAPTPPESTSLATSAGRLAAATRRADGALSARPWWQPLRDDTTRAMPYCAFALAGKPRRICLSLAARHRQHERSFLKS
jgi:hypothetical protein